MEKEEINTGEADLQVKNLRNPRILLAPLDWGLGHATRCIPIVKELISQGAEVWLAAEGAQEALLRTEFPKLNLLPLAGYKAKYPRSGVGMILQMLIQTPRFFKAIKQENEWLRTNAEKYQFDAVISDNRFGLYHPSIPCIFITHQLTIKTGFGKWSETFLRKRNYRFIEKFSECWVPDEAETKNGLAGELSHPLKLPAIKTKYLGVLSRFERSSIHVKKDHVLFILSGPEPQRSILENRIVNELGHYEGTATIVRALPGMSSVIPSTNNIRFYNHLSATELNEEMAKAEYVISRSGYSTIMDLAIMQKKSILIPTPGQTEQEYLGTMLNRKQAAYTVTQKEFSIEKSLRDAKAFNYKLAVTRRNELANVIREFLSSLK